MHSDLQTFDLPGGLFDGRRVYRQARFVPLTGHIEARIAALGQRPLPDLERSIEILGCAVGLGPELKPDPGMARLLCLGDRQFLMLCLSSLAGGEAVWFHPQCAGCGRHFDIQVRWSQVPVKPGGAGYPLTQVQCGEEMLRFRIPNGLDEASIRGQAYEQAVAILLMRCLVVDSDKQDAAAVIRSLTPAQIEKIEQSLDTAAPDVGSRVDTQCPECGRPQVVVIPIDRPPEVAPLVLYKEIHLLAQQYGWRESDILALPSWRRKLYIGIIEQARGFHG